jgi:uncharacterized protein YkwD
LITNEGPAGVNEAISVLKLLGPLPEYKWDDNLAKAARDHA